MDINLGNNKASIFKVMHTVRKGTLQSTHPSGAMSYVHNGRTAIGTWEDGAFNLIRFIDKD